MSEAMQDMESSEIFARNLQSKAAALQQCQQSRAFASCSECEAFIDCEVRKSYVRAVYESMSKGQQGDFDFN